MKFTINEGSLIFFTCKESISTVLILHLPCWDTHDKAVISDNSEFFGIISFQICHGGILMINV